MFRYDDPDKMLKVNDVAAILNVHPNTIRHWTEQGRIAVCRIGSRGDRRFRQSDIARFVDESNPFKQTHGQH